MARRRRSIRRIRYVPRQARRNPAMSTLLLVGGAALAAWFVWRRVKAAPALAVGAKPAAYPALYGPDKPLHQKVGGKCVNVYTGKAASETLCSGAEITMAPLDLRIGVGGVLGSGGRGSLG